MKSTEQQHKVPAFSKRWVFVVIGGVTVVALALIVLVRNRPAQSGLLATVGERSITVEDFRKEVDRRRAAHRPVPDKDTLLKEMVDFEALLQRARKSGLTDDLEVQREINSLLVAKLKERELAPRIEAVSVTTNEITAEYARNAAKYVRPAKERLAILFLEGERHMSEGKRTELSTRLEEARRKLVEKSGSPAGSQAMGFGALALDYSDDQSSRYRGGDIGWLESGNYSYRWPHQVLEAGYALSKGQVSGLIETDQGFYVVMKTDHRDSYRVPEAEVTASLGQTLRMQKQRELEAAYRQETASLAGVKINQRELATVEIGKPAKSVEPNQKTDRAELSTHKSLHAN
jgi:peptidyl-prolyl cis-trans isomerase C